MAQEQTMAEGSGGSGNTFLAFIVGGLLVFVALVFVYGLQGSGDKTIKVELPKIDRPK
jgi:hypothetical protein